MAAYMEGPLSKWTNVMKGWQYRWFVLDDNTGLLSYYTSKDKMKRGARRGCVRLRDAIIGIDDEDDSTFTITVDQKVFHFQARDTEERKQWARALEDTILRHSQRQVDVVTNNALDEFDKKLAEADAYLQLLLGNIKGVETKINALENPSEKQNMEGILITAQEMVEAVKKSIVLLQLAKTAVTANALHERPVFAAEHAPSTLVDEAPVAASLDELPPATATPDANKPVDSSADEYGDGSGFVNGSLAEAAVNDTCPLVVAEVKEKAVGDDKVHPVAEDVFDLKAQGNEPTVPMTIPPKITKEDIPARSYSTSEDEGDEFYDAEDARSIQSSSKSKSSSDTGQSEPTEVPIPVEHVRVEEPEPAETESRDNDEAPPTDEGASLDAAVADSGMYMSEEDSDRNKEGESVEEHKSVIMHLLSQVKLGMDLTKVVLPTFILERRSLLEMYADFFAHPRLFLAIADQSTPEERMIACARFYLSTFSAGRDSSVAKKPYNPILGETFRCFYDVSVPGTDQASDVVADGPVPWVTSDQLAFVAEQVSHHPPVSAFYAEHANKKIQFNGHIWTKSKFLGLSIGVHNIGLGCIRLVDRDEEYIVNFPNGYGRSILTVPWVELGGDCTITCEKTGYSAFVKFHTKPFYGGKVHRVTAEIFEPNARKPFCTIDGEWNALMYATFTSGRNECFFDAKRKKKQRKFVKKIDLQEPTESRRLWEKVTISLRTDDIDSATESKRSLEDKQRQDAKQRLESGVVYKPKLFHEDDCQNWIYNTPLTDRL